MKLFTVVMAVIAAVSADVSHLHSTGYHYDVPQPAFPLPSVHVEEHIPVQPDRGYLPPQEQIIVQQPEHIHLPVENHVVPSVEYLPPQQQVTQVLQPAPVLPVAPVNEYLPPPQVAQVLPPAPPVLPVAPVNEYLPPQQQITQEQIIVQQPEHIHLPVENHVVPNLEYLPPQQQVAQVLPPAPINEYLPPPQVAPVLPPAPIVQVAPINEYLPPTPIAPIAETGYHYDIPLKKFRS